MPVDGTRGVDIFSMWRPSSMGDLSEMALDGEHSFVEVPQIVHVRSSAGGGKQLRGVERIHVDLRVLAVAAVHGVDDEVAAETTRI